MISPGELVVVHSKDEIPDFQSEAEAATFFETHRLSDALICQIALENTDIDSSHADELLKEAEKRLFGNEYFKNANPQVRLQMCMLTMQNVLAMLICNPSVGLEIEAACAVKMINNCTQAFIAQYKAFETTWCGGHIILLDRKPFAH